MKILLVTTTAFLLSQLTFGATQNISYLAYLARFGKSYSSKAEFILREARFMESLRIIDANKNDSSIVLELNEWADVIFDRYDNDTTALL